MVTITVRPRLRYSPLTISCEKCPEVSFPTSVAPFSLAALLALASIQEGLAAASMLNVLAMLGSAVLLALGFIFYYLAQGLKHLEREAHYAGILTPTLEVESFIVVVGEHFGEEPLVVVKTLGSLWDGFVIYLACLLTHIHSSFSRR